MSVFDYDSTNKCFGGEKKGILNKQLIHMRICFLKAFNILHLLSGIAKLEIKVTNIKKIRVSFIS